MTDNEIIKAFKCITYGEIDKCLRCPYDVYKECETFVYEDALNLIKRQQAEIDRLTTENERVKTKIYKMAIDKALAEKARVEAIKEFADRIIGYIDVGRLRPPTEICFSELDVQHIVERIAKEMVGADNG